MQQSSNNGKRRLIASLAAMVAFSTMAASIMSGCGCDDKTSTSDETVVVHETQIVTHVETYTEVVVDDEGNTEYVEETRYVTGEGSQASNSSDSSASGAETSEADENQSSAEKSESSVSKKSESSAASSSSSSSSSKTSKSSGKLAIGGSSFNVGDTVVCTYTLTSPQVLENYQAYVTYDSSKLTCTSAKMSDAASSGAMLNYKTAGKIYVTGSNIGSGYDFTKGGTFLTVTYTVKAAGSTSTDVTWEVACNQNDENLISNGTPVSGFTFSESWSD